ncbi:MFS transporter [Solwaraspora sp. WMMD937]|nr:MFS transporter [Solwaraspora sp. WMMD937]WFE24645.1 MFS transporter [Solwaraspora sp. WMMD937]
MLGYSPLQAGLQLSALSVAIVGGSLVVARLQHRYGNRTVVVTGFVAICVGYLLVARVGADSTWLEALPGLVLIGAGMGLLFAPLMGISVSVVPPQQAGMASGTANAFFPLGTAVGAAVFGAVLPGRVRRRPDHGRLGGRRGGGRRGRGGVDDGPVPTRQDRQLRRAGADQGRCSATGRRRLIAEVGRCGHRSPCHR